MPERPMAEEHSDRLVDGKRFLVFASIEADPNASSVGWLRARLEELAAHVRCGGSLCLHEPTIGGQAVVSSLDGLRAWADRHFPVARFEPK